MTAEPVLDIAERVDALERRLRDLEDRREITQLITFIGPAADSGHAGELASQWLPDGVYKVGTRVFAGREGVHTVISGGRHPGYMAEGCAHLMTPPHIRIDGDKALAVNYTVLMINNHETGLWEARRCSANRWRLARVAEGWQVQDRTIDVLDGSENARQLLSSLFAE